VYPVMASQAVILVSIVWWDMVDAVTLKCTC
jgi:hypothetical protein